MSPDGHRLGWAGVHVGADADDADRGVGLSGDQVATLSEAPG